MTKTNSVVAIYDTHSLAEEAVKNLQRSGFDMKKLSIVGKAFEKGGSIVSWPGSERGRPSLTPYSRAIRARRQAQREIVHNGENGAIRPALNRYLILRAVAWMRSIQNLSLGV